jgi:hypothetical protein
MGVYDVDMNKPIVSSQCCHRSEDELCRWMQTIAAAASWIAIDTSATHYGHRASQVHILTTREQPKCDHKKPSTPLHHALAVLPKHTICVPLRLAMHHNCT